MEWPTREEWSKRRRTPYADMMPQISDEIARYATAEEIEALQKQLRQRANSLTQQARKTFDADLAYQGRCVRRGLKMVKAGELPWCLEDHCGAVDLLAPFIARRKLACADAYKRREAEIAATPIDDAAWERELEHRARVDTYIARSRTPGSRRNAETTSAGPNCLQN